MDGRSLFHYLNDSFNEQELRSLCFELGLEYDDLAAQGAEGKARELVRYYDRRNKLWVLISAIASMRPDFESQYKSRVNKFDSRPLVPTAARKNGDRLYFEFIRDASADTNNMVRTLAIIMSVSVTTQVIILLIVLVNMIAG